MTAFELLLYIVAIVFALGFFGDRHTTTEATPAPAPTTTTEPIEPADSAITEPELEATAEPATEPTAATPEPATEAATPDLQALNVAELRRRATLARYPWRNAHGRNRHSSKAELIAALTA